MLIAMEAECVGCGFRSINYAYAQLAQGWDNNYFPHQCSVGGLCTCTFTSDSRKGSKNMDLRLLLSCLGAELGSEDGLEFFFGKKKKKLSILNKSVMQWAPTQP